MTIKRIGFWQGMRGSYDPPPSSEKGMPPYTEAERSLIKQTAATSREEGLRLVKELNGMA